MKVNEIIRKRRKELGLTLKDVATELGVSESLISRYESNDVKNMGIDKLIPLAKVLKCTPAFLMGAEDDPKPAVKEVRITSVTRKDYINKIEEERQNRNLSIKRAKEFFDTNTWVKDENVDDSLLTSIIKEWNIPIIDDSRFLSNKRKKLEIIELQNWFDEKTNDLDAEQAKKIKESIEPIINIIIQK